MSFKSIVVGWLRAALVVTAISSFVAGILVTLQYVDGNREKYNLSTVLVPWLLLVGAFIVYWLTLKFTFASRERALHLGEQLGFSPLLVEKFLDQRFQEELENNDRKEDGEPESAPRKSPQDA